MPDLFRAWFGAASRSFRTYQNVMLENLALRQKLLILKRRHPKPRLGLHDKLFWFALRRLWSDRKKCLYLVAPDTVPRGHLAPSVEFQSQLSQLASAQISSLLQARRHFTTALAWLGSRVDRYPFAVRPSHS